MASSIIPFVIFQITMYLVVIGFVFYLTHKWMKNQLKIKEEQNELLRERLKTLDKK